MPTHLSAAEAPEDLWRCHECGWTYPNHHPSAKHRRNHKKQCGKIPGYTTTTKDSNPDSNPGTPTATSHAGKGFSDDGSSDEEHHRPSQQAEAREEEDGHLQEDPPETELPAVERISSKETSETLSARNSPPIARSTSFDNGEAPVTPKFDKETASSARSFDLSSQAKPVAPKTPLASEQGQTSPGYRSLKSVHAVDGQWICRHCGWTFSNSHPSAKQRRKHKKKCDATAGHAGTGGSSDDASSDEENHRQNGSGNRLDLSGERGSGSLAVPEETESGYLDPTPDQAPPYPTCVTPPIEADSVSSAGEEEDKSSSAYPQIRAYPSDPPRIAPEPQQEVESEQEEPLERFDSGGLDSSDQDSEHSDLPISRTHSFGATAYVKMPPGSNAAAIGAKLDEVHSHASSFPQAPTCDIDHEDGYEVECPAPHADETEPLSMSLVTPPTAEPQVGSVYASTHENEFLSLHPSSTEGPTIQTQPEKSSVDVEKRSTVSDSSGSHQVGNGESPEESSTSDAHSRPLEKANSSQSQLEGQGPSRTVAEEPKASEPPVTVSNSDTQQVNDTTKQEARSGSLHLGQQASSKNLQPKSAGRGDVQEAPQTPEPRSAPGSPDGWVRSRVQAFEKMAGLSPKSSSPRTPGTPGTPGTHHLRKNGITERTGGSDQGSPDDLQETISRLRHRQSSDRKTRAGSEEQGGPGELQDVMAHLRHRGTVV